MNLIVIKRHNILHLPTYLLVKSSIFTSEVATRFSKFTVLKSIYTFYENHRRFVHNVRSPSKNILADIQSPPRSINIILM